MGFLNIGRKDEYGKQRRIEHRGKYLRASRTGGVALRAQAKAMGANLTANTNRGFRVSTTPLKNTQVALQNGRFVLRGRYSHGPFQFNLSKTGVTASTRNRLGTFNWIKPQRSSAKLFGVQFRGRKAVNLQVLYMLFAAVAAVCTLLFRLFVRLLEVLVLLPGIIYRATLASPYASSMLMRRYRNWRLSRTIARLERYTGREMDSWQVEELAAGAVLILAAWGRGNKTTEMASVLEQAIAEHTQEGPLQRSLQYLPDTSLRLEKYTEEFKGDPVHHLALMAMLASRLARKISEDELPEVLLEADEITLNDGPRTMLQERMLEVFGDFAGLQLFEEDSVALAEESYPAQAPDREFGHVESKLDLNSASLEELQALPHIGEERAKAIAARRPFFDMEELKEIDGIGPQRLESIRAYATVR
ncbi:Helix-hairpin-helix DNA-binding class 1 [Desulfonatronospira thiodismutans ASO3-1]|uniref:Helix-hairpin-helix DNA-binding class 1 n=1 Tax=Desulfonatronospira thiodismutans ASO3-1 TaxID=555779 RepID=D6SMY9_9BACT|nr:Helix-hairpin-helix DNA-binding class 1 [Desulfonatronospira thiodismutans ASO3-1]